MRRSSSRVCVVFGVLLVCLFGSVAAASAAPYAWIGGFGSAGWRDGQVWYPFGVDVNPAGDRVYVADTGNGRVVEYTSAGAFIRNFGTYGNQPGQMDDPIDVAVSEGGTIYVADSVNCWILAFDSAGNYIGQIGEYGTAVGKFQDISGIAVSGGVLWVADGVTNRVTAISLAGGSASAFSVSGATDVVPSGGYVYVTSYPDNAVWKFSASGQYVSTIAGFGYGPGQVSGPWGIDVNETGGICVSDNRNHRVQVFSAEGILLETISAAGASALGQPNGIAAYANRLFVMDTNRVQVYERPAADTTPPRVTLTVGGVAGDNDWHISDVSLSLVATDGPDGSGIGSVEYSLDGRAWQSYDGPVVLQTEGYHSFDYRAFDQAGNESPDYGIVSVKIDKTAPAVAIASPTNGTYLSSSQTTASWTAEDELSGLAESWGTVADGGDVFFGDAGLGTFSVHARDAAGNVTDETVTYVITDVPSPALTVRQIVRTAKAGSVIPMFAWCWNAETGQNEPMQGPWVMKVYVSPFGSGWRDGKPAAGKGFSDNTAVYDPAVSGYRFNLDTKGMSKGFYSVWFIPFNVSTGASASGISLPVSLR